MKYIGRIFLKGILTLIPFVITVYIVYWFLKLFESFFGSFILFFTDEYIPGMGILLGVVAIFAAGILIQVWGLRVLYRWGEQVLGKFPLIGDLYNILKSFFEYITYTTKDEAADQVVLIQIQEYRFIGIITRSNFDDAPKGIVEKDMIAVYLPMSYLIGGYTIYVHKDKVTPINMTKKVALQWILTAGISAKKMSESKP